MFTRSHMGFIQVICHQRYINSSKSGSISCQFSNSSKILCFLHLCTSFRKITIKEKSSRLFTILTLGLVFFSYQGHITTAKQFDQAVFLTCLIQFASDLTKSMYRLDWRKQLYCFCYNQEMELSVLRSNFPSVNHHFYHIRGIDMLLISCTGKTTSVTFCTLSCVPF